MTGAATFAPATPGQMLAEVEREIAMREQGYPHQVASRRLKQRAADYQLHVMRGVRDKIRESIDKQKPRGAET